MSEHQVHSMLETVATWYVGLACAFVLYTYAGYPMLVALLAWVRSRRSAVQQADGNWPRISIMIPAYHEELEIAATLEALLQADYPAQRREIIVVSDASTDGTDAIVNGFAQRGVKLIRMKQRSGKTAAENAAAPHVTGTIVVNTDASTRIAVDSLKQLVAGFTDPRVGVVSGRDVSTSRSGAGCNVGESRYVGYEMKVRSLESAAGGIIGASGCLYAIRSTLHKTLLPDGLSRDFAAALIAREHGYRAISASQAICYVPRTSSLRAEYRRKVRTMTRGMETLYAMRSLLNPFRYGAFAWMLFSHKVCRWLVPWVALGALASLGVLAVATPELLWVVGLLAAVLVLGSAALVAPEEQVLARLVSLPGYLLIGNVAALQASVRALYGDRNAVWEPTRRGQGSSNSNVEPRRQA